jgi:hypothetical protein
MSIEAMKRAHDALNSTDTHPLSSAEQYFKETQAMKALEDAIKDAEEREWQGLTEQDVHDAFNFTEFVKQLDFDRDRPEWCESFAAYIEAKLKEKNT